MGLVTGNPPSHRLNVNISPNLWFWNLANLHHFFLPLKKLCTLSEKLCLLELFKFNMTVCKTWKSFWHPCQKFGCCSWVMTFSFVYAFMWPELKLPCSSAYTDSAQCGFYNIFVSANEVQRRMWCTRCTGFLSSSDGDAQHVPVS